MKVTVYSTSWCAFCKTEMQWLDSKGIEYEHINIEEQPELNKGYTSVPVTEIDNQVIVGFDRPKLSAALGL